MKKRKKLPSISSLEKKLDIVFQTWVRRSAADEGGTLECYTCRKPVFWKEADAGHFVPGRRNAVLLNPEVVRPQCKMCNIWNRGAYHAYTLRMVDELGREKVDELLALQHQTLKFTRSDLEEKIAYYKQKLETLDVV